jgi:hypothetical protein
MLNLRSLQTRYGEGGETRFAQAGWTAICLHSKNGDVFDDEKSRDPSLYRETEALNHAPYFKHILDNIRSDGCQLHRVRLSILQPRQLIPWHQDSRIFRIRRNRGNHLRLHVPIVTNPDVVFRIGPYQVAMSAGELLNFEVSYPHQVYNGGEEIRVHLLIDCLAPYSFLKSNFGQMTSGRSSKRPALKDYYDQSQEELKAYRHSFRGRKKEHRVGRARFEKSEFLASTDDV